MKLNNNFQVDVSGCTSEEIKEMAEFAADELGCEVDYDSIDVSDEFQFLWCDIEVLVGSYQYDAKSLITVKDFRAMMKAKNIKPKDLACFKEVADVIGEERAEIQLASVINIKDCHFDTFLSEKLCNSFDWSNSIQGYDFWDSIDNNKNPYDAEAVSKTHLGNSVSSAELEKQNAAQKALDYAHCGETVSEKIARRTTEEPVEFVDMDGKSIAECLELPMDIAVKMSKENAGHDNDNKKTPAHQVLEAGVKHMKDRASERDSEDGERSMKSTVDAFNSIFSDCLVSQGGKITEEQGWHFMTLLKISRSKGGDYRQDDYEDAAAYQALAGETASVDRREKHG